MKWLTVIIFILAHHQVTSFFPSFSDLKALGEYAYDVYGKFNEVYDAYGTYTTDVDLDRILEQVNDITQTVNDMGTKLGQKVDQAVQIIIRHLPLTAKVDSGLYDLHNHIVRVDGLWDEYKWYTARIKNFNNYTMNHFAAVIISHRGNDMTDALNRIYRLISIGRTSSIRENLFQLLIRHAKMTEAETCDEGQTPQQRLFRIYGAIMLTEVRAFIMKCFAYVHLGKIKKGNFKAEHEKAEQQLLLRGKQYIVAVKRAMKKTPRYIYRCDPPFHKRNQTYWEFEHFIQGYVANEETLSDQTSCSGTCADRSKGKFGAHHRCPRDKSRFCPMYTCLGKLINCTTGGSGVWDMCEHDTRSPRRYGWYLDGENKMNGVKDPCVNGFKHKFQWYQPGKACEYCRCICVDDAANSHSTHTVSLRKQVSDTQDNMVVTGVRLVMMEYMLHIQIKQGKMLEGGSIQSDSESWKPLETFKFDYWYSESTNLEKFNKTTDGKNEELKYGVDFAPLHWTQRQINIDDIYAPHGHVVTGVRFIQTSRPSSKKESSPIELAIRVTSFDYATGKLTNDREGWTTAATMDDKPTPYARSRIEFSLDGRVGNPTKSLFNQPDSVPNSYVKLWHSGLREDAAQSTIPFLDAQPVHGDPGFALGGVGLFHKGDEVSGGFLALRIFSIDYPQYMNDELPENLVVAFNETMFED